MKAEGITFTGPPIDDLALLEQLPAGLATMLHDANGFIVHRGGFHLRGACLAPWWHSIRHAWEGPLSFQHLYPAVEPRDIPFGEDCLGDQFLLRGATVVRLDAETGIVKSMEMGIPEFFRSMEADPRAFLQMNPLLRYELEGGSLSPGQLLSAAPPFFLQSSSRSLCAIDTRERRGFLADIAHQIRDVPDGSTVQFVAVPSKGPSTKE